MVNVSAKLDALIDRSSVMVAELTSAWTMAEYRIAIARIKESEDETLGRRPLRLIVVVTDPEQLPASAKGLRVLTRAKNISDVADGFIADLAGLLRGIAEETGLERNREPERLFEAKEYRAAVISEMTLLEARLREKLNKVPWPQTSRPLSMRSLIEQGIEQGVVPQILKPSLDAWIRVRNEVVHSAIAISRAQASEIVGNILKLIGHMENK